MTLKCLEAINKHVKEDEVNKINKKNTRRVALSASAHGYIVNGFKRAKNDDKNLQLYRAQLYYYIYGFFQTIMFLRLQMSDAEAWEDRHRYPFNQN